MIKCSTYRPRGNHERCAQVYGLAQELLRVTDDLRNKMGVPFLSNQRYIDDGLTLIRVTASQDHNSIIEITSSVPPEEPKKHIVRQRLLHCRIELTLAEDMPEDIDTDDGTIGWPYQKDPSFIAVEPIPVKEDEENKIIFHTTFEVDLRRGIIVDGLNGERDDNESCDDNLGRKDACRLLSLEDAEPLITMRTKYNLVPKVLDNDNDDEPFKVFNFKESTLKEEPVTEFNTLQDLNIWDYPSTPYIATFEQNEVIDDYDCGIRSGMAGWVSGSANGVATLVLDSTEPLEKYVTVELSTHQVLNENNELVWLPDGEEDIIHLTKDVANYYDTIELPEVDRNIHPHGNINNAKLRHSYGLSCVLRSPFTWIVSDFTPRINDKVFIGDIGRASTRNENYPITVTSFDHSTGGAITTTAYPDVRLIASIMPYYVESKDTKELRETFNSETVGWNFYGKDPAYWTLSGDLTSSFYLPWSCNWLLHPFRNKTWGESLSDFYNLSRGTTEQDNNPWWAENSLFEESYDAYDDSGCVYCDPPNRIILCVRSFFANTENATKFEGTRRVYDVEYPVIYDEINDQNGNRCYGTKGLDTYDEVDTETSQPLSAQGCPNFMTIKGDVVVVNLLSSIYAVSDYEDFTIDSLKISPRRDEQTAEKLVEDGSPTGPSITRKRSWPAYLDGNWGYTNIYGAGITVGHLGTKRTRYRTFEENASVSKDWINSEMQHKLVERSLKGESIYSDSNEDIDWRYIPEMPEGLGEEESTWKEEDTPESHLIHCIYRELEKEEYDIHHPVCHIKIETNLYDRHFDLRTLKVVE